jgi:lysophospholipase L1-like esterase
VVRFAWSGSGLVFRFDGTHAAVRMDDPAGFYTRLVDGQEVDELRTMPGERSYEVATGLSDGPHEVALYRRTEASFGVTRFLGVELGDDGELLPPPPAPERRLELIGDSISCGYGDEGSNESCSFEAATENHWLTYGAISARDLDAELITVAWSGKGVVDNYGDDKNDPMPQLYPRTLPQDPQSRWDFAQWQADAVVINLGTNDFSTDGDPSDREFSDAYRALLEQLRMHYPDAWIICLEPTLLGGTDLDTVSMYIDGVVSERNAAGDERVVASALQFSVDGFGCDYHPSLATHRSMANALTAELQRIIGW